MTTTWTLGDTSGVQVLRAVLAADTSVSSTITATAYADLPDSMFLFAGNAQTELPSKTLPHPIQVKLVDRYGNGVPDAPITFMASGGGALDGIALALPALLRAAKLGKRAARVGFDWPEIEGVLDKIAEEIQEVKEAEGDWQLADEMGDLLFALVNLARWKKVDAESALRGTNTKFRKRFAYVEQGAKRQGRNLSDMKLEEMDALWNEAKKKD